MQLESERPGRSVDYYVVMALFALGLILRIFFFNGPIGSDDIRYFEYSERLIAGDPFTALDHAASRLLLLLLAGAPGALAGSLALSGAINVLYSLAADFIAVAFAYSSLGPRQSVFVALILLPHGLAASYAGTLSPEPLLTVFLLSAVLLTQIVVERGPTRSLALLFVAGLFGGAAYSVKDTGVLLLPPITFYLLFLTKHRAPAVRLLQVASFCVGFALIWIVECAVYAWVAGDFLYKYRAIALVHNAAGDVQEAPTLYQFVRVGWWNLTILLREPILLALPIGVGVVAWIAVIVRSGKTAVLALFGGFATFYLIFGSSSITRLINLPFQERYALSLLPFVVLPIAEVIRPVLDFRRTGTILLSLVGTAVLPLSVSAAAQRAGALYYTEDLRNAAAAVLLIPVSSEPIHAEGRLCKSLRHFLDRSDYSRVQCLNSYGNVALNDGFYIVPARGRLASFSHWSQKRPATELHLVAAVRTNQRNVHRLLGLGNSAGNSVIEVYRKGQLIPR